MLENEKELLPRRLVKSFEASRLKVPDLSAEVRLGLQEWGVRKRRLISQLNVNASEFILPRATSVSEDNILDKNLTSYENLVDITEIPQERTREMILRRN